MDCYDASAQVYYPRHEEYVGPRPDLLGRCCRCLEVTDPALASAGAAQMRRAEKEIAARENGDAEARRQGRRLELRRARSGRPLTSSERIELARLEGDV